MGFHRGPNIVTEGLKLSLDAGNEKSYPGTGTIWYDKSGNNNNGTLINGPVYSPQDSGILVFDGVNDYINTAYRIIDVSEPDNGASRPLTISLWINPDSTQIHLDDGTRPLWAGVAAFTGFGLAYYESTYFLFHRVDGLGLPYYGEYLDLGLVKDTWNHVTLMWGGLSDSTIYGYVDGQLLHQVPISYAKYRDVFLNNRFFRLGFPYNSGGNNASTYFKGKMSLVHTYHRVLTGEEVLQNYNATKGRFDL